LEKLLTERADISRVGAQSREIGLVRRLRQWLPLSATSLMHCKYESTIHFHKIQRQIFFLYFTKHDTM